MKLSFEMTDSGGLVVIDPSNEVIARVECIYCDEQKTLLGKGERLISFCRPVSVDVATEVAKQIKNFSPW